MDIDNAGTSGNTVKGNYIGTNAAGTAASPTATASPSEAGPEQHHRRQQRCRAQRHLRQRRARRVLVSSTGTNGNAVKGNYIGTDAAGTAALPNNTGVVHRRKARRTTPSGARPARGNLIAYNASDGVQVDGAATTGNTIRGNSIHSNGGKGIENDGGNAELAPPVITGFGSVMATACPNCTIDVDLLRRRGRGPGLRGSTTADNGGDWTFDGSPRGPTSPPPPPTPTATPPSSRPRWPSRTHAHPVPPVCTPTPTPTATATPTPTPTFSSNLTLSIDADITNGSRPCDPIDETATVAGRRRSQGRRLHRELRAELHQQRSSSTSATPATRTRQPADHHQHCATRGCADRRALPGRQPGRQRRRRPHRLQAGRRLGLHRLGASRRPWARTPTRRTWPTRSSSAYANLVNPDQDLSANPGLLATIEFTATGAGVDTIDFGPIDDTNNN